MSQQTSKFSELLARDQPLLLDGGLATQLEAQGCDISNDLWSASLLDSNPDSILAAHKAYLQVGAECIATASYQASRDGYAKRGYTADESDALMLLSVMLAKRARDDSGCDAAIAASLGPYGAMLHDGSEYRGNYGVSADTLRAFHEPRLRLFDAARVDVLALETIPSKQEAIVLSELLVECNTPSWVSFSCADEAHICDGTPLAEVVALFDEHPTTLAVGINCTPPQFAPALVRHVRRAAPKKAAMAYPNSGEIYEVSDNSWSGTVTPVDCAMAAEAWIEAGANIVGGCCRMGPQHIAAMAGVVNAGHR